MLYIKVPWSSYQISREPYKILSLAFFYVFAKFVKPNYSVIVAPFFTLLHSIENLQPRNLRHTKQKIWLLYLYFTTSTLWPIKFLTLTFQVIRKKKMRKILAFLMKFSEMRFLHQTIHEHFGNHETGDIMTMLNLSGLLRHLNEPRWLPVI